MSPRGLMAWPPLALLLLWLPGEGSLHGTSKVTGTVGGSLIVQCQYGKEFKDNDKLWCKKSVFYCKDIVKTRGSGGKVRSGRVSIRDHPAKLSFTVTMERLTLEDAGSYECWVDTPWLSILDLSFKVEVAVQPGEPLPPAGPQVPELSQRLPSLTQAWDLPEGSARPRTTIKGTAGQGHSVPSWPQEPSSCLRRLSYEGAVPRSSAHGLAGMCPLTSQPAGPPPSPH
uniref:Ig-like domain-containing protein n=1 Tax=Urocitellus parryii TaxID=9999 RepID=A0A8D2KF61_UROPR